MNNGKKILIVDDEKDIRELISYNLKKENFFIESAVNGIDALEKLNSSFDLVILDVMMPQLDGLETCRKIRASQEEYHNIPIILLTAKDGEVNEIVGLEMGADDYITKPVSMSKLVARVRAALRRGHPSDDKKLLNSYKFGQLEIDVDAHIVKCCGERIILTKTEFELLHILVSQPNKVYRRDELLNRLVGSDVVVTDRVVDVHIRKIREKLDSCGHYIHTIRGVGYAAREE